jgi:hypothetical protein
MELLAVRTARLIAYLNVEELNPSGFAIAHKFFYAFTEHYKFLKRPMTADEMLDTQDKGINFEAGKFGEIGITRLGLFNWGVIVETNSSTDDCEAILKDMLDWAAETFKLANRPNLITRRNYVSEIIFSSLMSFPAISPILKKVGEKLTNLVGGYLGQSLPFELGGLHWFFDASQTKQLFTPFRIERFTAGETPFLENKYYSGAPLRTADHIQIIREFELAFPPEGVLPLPIE